MRVTLLFFLLSELLMAEILERTQLLMGTYATISIDKKDTQVHQKAFELLRKVDQTLSSYQSHADIYILNHQRETSLSFYTYEALQLSQRYYKETDGYFDITVGSITKGLYHFGTAERIPSKREREKAVIDFKGLHFTSQRAWLEEGVLVDLGGMGKGFGVDKTVAYLHEQNITKGQVALSGDIHCLDQCEIAIEDPFGSGIIAEFTTKTADMSISTSGNYRRYVKSKRDNHLIDPKEKVPQQLFASITLISYGNNSDIDAYATAASVMPLDAAISFLNRQDVGYVLITTGGDQYISEDLDRYVEKMRFLGRGVLFECETI